MDSGVPELQAGRLHPIHLDGTLASPRAAPVANEDSQAAEDLRARLIEGSPDCIKVLDLDARLLSMNAGGMKVLEICDLTPLIGSSWIDFWQGADREKARAAVTAARLGGLGRFVGFFATTRTKTPK